MAGTYARNALSRASEVDGGGNDAGALFCRLGFIKKQRCAVCEREYIKDNLPAVVSYRAVERLRETWCEQFGTVMRKDARYAAATKLYDQVRVCVFCFQFFGAPQHTDISCWSFYPVLHSVTFASCSNHTAWQHHGHEAGRRIR